MPQLAAGGTRVLDVTIGQQAEGADTDTAVGEHVPQAAASALESPEREECLHTAVPVVLPRAGDAAVFQWPQAVMGERHTVRIAAQLGDHLSRAPEGTRGVDDPWLSTGGLQPAREGGWIGQRSQFAAEGALTLWGSLEQSGPEETADTGAADVDGAEEGLAPVLRAAARNPALAIGRESAAGNEAVQVGVMPPWLAPGVQHGEKADLGS